MLTVWSILMQFQVVGRWFITGSKSCPRLPNRSEACNHKFCYMHKLQALQSELVNSVQFWMTAHHRIYPNCPPWPQFIFCDFSLKPWLNYVSSSPNCWLRNEWAQIYIYSCLSLWRDTSIGRETDFIWLHRSAWLQIYFFYLKNSISHKLLEVSRQVKPHWKGKNML